MNLPVDQSDPLLDDLTEPQRQAVTHVEGPLLVLAGAGSGKTRTITRRIAYLVLRVGIAPWNILAITFTNKAAGEMRERVRQMLSERQANAVTVCTFHSLCARVIREYADRLGLPTGYSIYDTADQQRAVKQALQELEINANNFPPGSMLSAISKAKNDLLDAAGYETARAHDFQTRIVAKVFKKYESILQRNHALDFDDLMLRTVQLMRQFPDVLDQLRDRFQYLLIDEYQDTNHAQFVLAQALAARHSNICATGDPDQSIYGWRGADIRNILDFETQYPDATTIRLEQNYRSTKHILAAADGLIRNNARRKHKSLWTENEEGTPVQVARCSDERAEALWVVNQFQKWHDELEIPWSGFAVFYRINSLSRVIEDAFRTAAIPYQIARGTAFYERKEIKDAVSYLRVVVNPADEVTLIRIINTPARGISDRTVQAIQAHAVAHGVTMADVLTRPEQVAVLNARAVAAVQRFANQLEQWRKLVLEQSDRPAPSLRMFVEDVLRESGLEDAYRNDKSDPDQDRLANLGELVSSAQQFEGEFEQERGEPAEMIPLLQKLEAYLERISLVSDVDSLEEGGQGAVTLLTLHSAKGLEFPAVAMIGVEEGLLPHSRAATSNDEAEEERRLCFVGITRARRLLAITHARQRTVFGQTQPTIPSRFLAELPRPNIEKIDLSQDDAWMPARSHRGESTLTPVEMKRQDLYPTGTLVRHAMFGVGRVLNVSSTGVQTRAQVDFGRLGVKTLILEYARLERLS